MEEPRKKGRDEPASRVDARGPESVLEPRDVGCEDPQAESDDGHLDEPVRDEVQEGVEQSDLASVSFPFLRRRPFS